MQTVVGDVAEHERIGAAVRGDMKINRIVALSTGNGRECTQAVVMTVMASLPVPPSTDAVLALP